MRCPNDVMHDAVNEELKKIGKSRKNQDRRIKVHGNYDCAIEPYYKYPLPPFHLHPAEEERMREKEEREREGKEERKEKGRKEVLAELEAE